MPGCSTRFKQALRISRSAAAADRHRRRAESHQPLGVRSAGGARHADRLRRRALRPFSGTISFATATSSATAQRRRRSSRRLRNYLEDHPATPGGGRSPAGRCCPARSNTFPIVSETRNSPCRWIPMAAPARALCWACRCCEGRGRRALLVLTREEPGHFTEKPDRARPDVRRPGGDRHRECAAVRRGAGTHPRTSSVAGGIAHRAGPAGPDRKSSPRSAS